MKIRLLAGVATLALCAASGASAQSALSGWYVAGDVGYHTTDGVKASSSTGASDWTFSAKDDWAAFGRIGYKLTPNWRVEGEYGYRSGDIRSVRGSAADPQPIGLCTAGVERTAAAPACGKPNGDLKATTLMANVIYDFMPDSSWRPFIGAGVGTAWVHNKVYGQLSGVPAGAAQFQNTSFDDVDQALAYQGILGIAWDFAPNWSLDLTGRYLQTDDLQWGSVTTNVGGPGHFGAVTDVGTYEGKYKDTSLTLGVRYTFGSPPPPPPPPPP
ncbi:MAG TPA: outer membrane beta-barrel protein, partial [Caulobacter sp.]|nr:outer membrane beta-barrel protein [Caulobacter sp.]